MFGIEDEEIRSLIAATDYSEALTITASTEEVRSACESARKYGFRAVVAFPQFTGLLVDALKGTGVRAQIPVGFPCGGVTTKVKCTEAQQGLERGATDLDMVMNISAFLENNYSLVKSDIQAVLEVAKPFGVPFKVIIEVGVLTDPQIISAAKIVEECGADFVKTCTGFAPGRATIHNISLIKEAVRDHIGIKASGGVASIEDGVALMRAGATVVALRGHLIDQLREQKWIDRMP